MWGIFDAYGMGEFKRFLTVYYILKKRAGGWPLTIIMTPFGKPFFAETYIPPFDRYGRAGLKRILLYLYEVYKNDKEEVIKSSESIENAVKSLEKTPKTQNINLNLSIIDSFINKIEANFDKINKGIGTKPKFPHASTLNILLDIYKIFDNKKALSFSLETLKAMAKGGIFDQIEGGFFRYSTDEK